ncbi:glycoside hydrolase family 3 protein [Dichotomicrobium thermohalophilum]|uniref:Beta-glucosidase-like glycosyl hydrolase n=1 Tax=Dichotomicrobium thermohalophilum TaxID=933063 RepID=A0A397Q664_9HYPH|nr:glycoside hydrolase family 3 N-terminal domain-containing protein [Dichotomicrobium thermohalophilum]RIA56572.1 beta-glucosidase-like glycosyl hydrolase [Dichotomicrobium thermohalophilum]
MKSATYSSAARATTFAAAVSAAIVLFAPGLAAQSPGESGLTGDPLVDSILQAPGPDFLDPRGRRDDSRLWDDEPRRERARERWDDAPPETAREGRDEPRTSAEEWNRNVDDWDDRAPERPSTREARREPPPPPAQRGDGPLDIIILDSDPSEPRITDVPEATDSPRAEVTEPSDASSGPEETRAAVEEPYREQAPGSYREEEAPAEAGNTGPDQVAAVTRPTGNPVPAPPTRAPERPRSNPQLERMIGQMIMVGFPGKTPSDPGVRRVLQQMETGKAGGVILMSRNIDTPRQVKQLTRALTRAGESQPTPFIAVDQEGGYVQRLSRVKGFKTHPSAERLGARNNPQAAYSAYRNLALELRDYGFNLNLGPVVDLNLNPANPVIGRLKRSYGKDPDHVTAYAKAFVYAHNETGLLTAAKHFPGHGSSDTDSHDVLVDISQSWQERELRPYRNLIEAEAIDMIMVGHLYHPAFSDSPDVPASLSPKAIERVLRDSLNFDGVVITDDLDMRGVRQNTNFEERIVGAVAAGNDILLITNQNGYQPDLPERVAEVIRAAIADGRLSEQRIRTSYERIMTLKDELARLQRTATNAGEDRGLAEHISGG